MALDPALEQQLLAHIRKGKKDLMGMAILAAAIGALPFIIGFAKGGPKTGQVVIGIVFFAIAGLLVFFAKQDPAQHPVFKVLRERAGDVVWAYVSTTRQGASVVRSEVVLATVDGKRLNVNAAIGSEQELLGGLARSVPHATVGFSPETEQQFLKDPASLRRQAAV